MDLQEIFTQAVTFHQRGQLEQAKALYLQLLDQLPDNINILANMGIVCRDIGNLQEAEYYCRKTVSAAPDDPHQLINLGAVLESKNDHKGARDCYEQALLLAPSHPKILNNLGKLLHQQGDSQRGKFLLEQAIAIEPEYPMALNNLGVLCSEKGDFDAAESYLRRSVELDPQNSGYLYNLAGIYNSLNQLDQAKILLEKTLALTPGHQGAAHMLAAITGGLPQTAPREYVEQIFDRYAQRFDDHIRNNLGYTVPESLAKLTVATATDMLPAKCALDLGCGTGLSGESFAPFVETLVGVDVSAQMLAKASEKNIYHRLEQQEIYPYLAKELQQFDLFIAADVLIYLGDPRLFFSAVAARARKDALLACSIETTDDAGYKLQPSGRYAHNSSDFLHCAESEGFELIGVQPHPIRKENGKWLPGELCIFRKNMNIGPKGRSL